MYIKNASELVKNGKGEAEKLARRLCLDAAEAALRAVEPSRLMESKVRVVGSKLVADGNETDLTRFSRVFVIGGGKAARQMADALESILGDRITDGIVNVLESQLTGSRGRRIRLHKATHPLPGAAGEEGVNEMLKMVGVPDPKTLVVCLVSGGGSSMLPLPANGITLSDKVQVTRSLLRAGATIQELNVVRKHLSAIKGGRLAQKLYPSTLLSLVVSDVVGNRLDSIASGPLYPDPSTFKDAERILGKYHVKDIPKAVERFLHDGAEGKIPETPKPGSKYFTRVSNVIIGSNEDACRAAVHNLNHAKCRSALLTASYEGEARSAGIFMGSIVRHAVTERRPSGIVAGGETTVVVRGQGKGGRNQEFALGAAMKIDGNGGVALISLGTDGLDGPTDAAGGIVDGFTVSKTTRLGLSVDDALSANDSYGLLKQLGDVVITGPTGTNVNDIVVAVIV